jgi:hypothetical protein
MASSFSSCCKGLCHELSCHVIGTDAGRLVHQVRVTAREHHVGFRAHHQEGGAEREGVETLEIDVAAVHDIERASFGIDLVEDVDVVHFAVSNA